MDMTATKSTLGGLTLVAALGLWRGLSSLPAGESTIPDAGSIFPERVESQHHDVLPPRSEHALGGASLDPPGEFADRHGQALAHVPAVGAAVEIAPRPSSVFSRMPVELRLMLEHACEREGKCDLFSACVAAGMLERCAIVCQTTPGCRLEETLPRPAASASSTSSSPASRRRGVALARELEGQDFVQVPEGFGQQSGWWVPREFLDGWSRDPSRSFADARAAAGFVRRGWEGGPDGRDDFGRRRAANDSP